MAGPDELLPSMPMTGPTEPPTTGLAPRRLGQEGQQAMPLTGDDYIVPARPSTLRTEAEAEPFTLRFLRRRLDAGVGPRRL